MKNLRGGAFYDEFNNILEIGVTVDVLWENIVPPYLPLKHTLEYYPDALINLAIFLPEPVRYVPSSIIAHMCRYLTLLRTHIARWKSLHLDARLVSIAFEYLDDMVPWTGDNLQNISLVACDEIRDKDKRMLRYLMTELWGPKQLAQSRGRRFNLTVSEPKRFGMKTFHDLPYAHLNSLTVTSTLGEKDIFDLIPACVNLTKAVFLSITVTDRRQAPSQTMLYCGNLLSLMLGADRKDYDAGSTKGAIFQVLKRIQAPNLKELGLGYEDQWRGDIFREFCRIARNIQTLHLIKLNIHNQELEQALARTSRLTHLCIDAEWPNPGFPPSFTRFTDAFLERLTVTPDRALDNEVLCPVLQFLTINTACLSPNTLGTFRSVIINRFQLSILREITIFDAGAIPQDEQALFLELRSKFGITVNFYNDLPSWIDLR